MSERDGYKAGTPSWIDLASPDVDAAVDFYGQLLGWDATDAGDPEETGGYRMFTLNGKSVAGVGPKPDFVPRPVWSTYFATDDVDATAEAVRGAGGSVLLEPMDVMTAGRMGFFADPSGAVFGAWQAGEHSGAQLVNDPGTLTWNELRTRDVEGSKAFYNAAFGWGGEPFAEMEGYIVWTLGGGDIESSGIGGMLEMGEDFPAEVPPHWDVVIAVEDPDATAAKAKDLGGAVTAGPMDIPVGRYAGLTDPSGAAFSIITARPDAQ